MQPSIFIYLMLASFLSLFLWKKASSPSSSCTLSCAVSAVWCYWIDPWSVPPSHKRKLLLPSAAAAARLLILLANVHMADGALQPLGKRVPSHMKKGRRRRKVPSSRPPPTLLQSNRFVITFSFVVSGHISGLRPFQFASSTPEQYRFFASWLDWS